MFNFLMQQHSEDREKPPDVADSRMVKKPTFDIDIETSWVVTEKRVNNYKRCVIYCALNSQSKYETSKHLKHCFVDFWNRKRQWIS